jgi:hypothetical protein
MGGVWIFSGMTQCGDGNAIPFKTHFLIDKQNFVDYLDRVKNNKVEHIL